MQARPASGSANALGTGDVTARYSIVSGDFAREMRATDTHRRVMLQLGLHSTRNGWIKLSQTKLAGELGLARESVNRAIRDLVEWRYVEKRDQSDTGRSICFYRIIMDRPTEPGDDAADADIEGDDAGSDDGELHGGSVSAGSQGGVSVGSQTCDAGSHTGVTLGVTPIRDHLSVPPSRSRAAAPREAGRAGGKAVRSDVEEMLERIALVPSREAVVDRLLRPICLRRDFRAPSVEHTLAALADWVAGQGLGDDDLARAAELVIERRRVIVNEAAIRDCVAEVKSGPSPTTSPDGKPAQMFISPSSHPEAAAAWAAYWRGTGDRRSASLVEKHGAYVPSLSPPPHHITGATP